MSRISSRAGLFSSVAPMLFASALFSSAAYAQPSGDAAAPQTAASEEDGNVIVVTGSLIRRTDTETPSPVTVLSADTIQKAGITTVSDAIRTISADSAGSIGTGFQSGFSAGGSAVSLRGLGVSSTLVLIDGLRSTNFPINDDGHNAYVDLNSIPFSLVERVEVLKDGASSTYGADAIGGVVNIILKKHFTGLDGTAEGGVTARGDGARKYMALTAGIGDYQEKGWNFYVNGEYQEIGRISNRSRGFPYNTLDLSSIGGLDNNAADNSLTSAGLSAVVTRTSQTDLNNPLAGGVSTAEQAAGGDFATYQLLNPGACAGNTYSISSGSARGTGCKYDLTDRYRQLQPYQQRYSANARLSVRLSDNVEGYLTGSYSRSFVSITSNFPSAIRQTQPYGAAPALASSNPGIVLPYFVCSAGINCITAPDRRLNPNNPYATNAAADETTAAANAARLYYIFGDIPSVSERTNEVYRFTGGLNGNFGDDWNWRVEAAGAWDELKLRQQGFLNINNLLNAINTGAYNFVDPNANSQAVRNFVSPDITTPSRSSTVVVDASITKGLFELPGGKVQLAVGGQIRWDTLANRNQNAALNTYNLTTSSAFGSHRVYAGYFELAAPVFDKLEINISGRYDNYSEGFDHFSPKAGFKFTPIKQFAIRGTYSEGFRAPTFAESNPLSQFAGFVAYTPPCNFQLAHGGGGTLTNCTSGGNTYNVSYQQGRGATGNPNLQPEISRSFTLGAIVEPTRWLSLTADYYNIRKSGLVVNGPDAGRAVDAYYAAGGSAAAGCAAVAAVGAGYSCNVVDAQDPLYGAAQPRLLILNVPFVNANYQITDGIDVSATVRLNVTDNIRWTSRLDATHILRSNVVTPSGVQRYAGTLGPYDLSSGNGTPDWRGSWQNTVEIGKVALTTTGYYVGKIKAVSQDQREPTDCARGNIYTRSAPQNTNPLFCVIDDFISVDLNATVNVTDNVKVYFNVQNLFDASAPLAAAAYTSAPNYLTTWHSAGAIGRQYKAGMNFRF